MSLPFLKCACGGKVDRLGWCTVCGAEVTEVPFADYPEKSADELRSGRKCGGGRFTLIERLGRGGMGEVWLAIDEKLSAEGAPAEVALKFLLGAATEDPEWVALLRREVLAARRLSHVNIIRVHDWHEEPGEPVFYSMEYVPGGTLRSRLAAQPEGRFTSAELTPFLDQLVSALQYSHTEVRMVHRDLKPANLLVTQNDQLKLTDFGLARSNLGMDASVSTEGGTPAYASPQQRRGEAPNPSDDIFSLGAVLYHLTTGSYPFTSEQLAEPGPLPRPDHPLRRLPGRRAGRKALSPEAAETILLCLHEDPSQRPPNAEAVGHWWKVGPPTPREPAHRGPVRLLLGIFTVLLLGLTLGAWLRFPVEIRQALEWLGFFSEIKPPFQTTAARGPNVSLVGVPTPRRTLLVLEPAQGFPLPARAEIYSANPQGGPPRSLWSVVLSNGPVAIPIPDSQGGLLTIEAGKGYERKWSHWVRTECNLIAHVTNRVALSLNHDCQLDLYLSTPAPLEIRDAWNNLVLQVDIEDYTRYFNPPSSLAPFRLSRTRTDLKHLTAGRYRMSLTAEATNLHHLEAWERTFDLPLPPREALSFVLPVWKRPRMGVIWTNSFNMVLLPIPGNPRALMARTETSLGQFRRYAVQAGIGDWPIESVGANGSEQQGHTWQSPGRNAEDSHPVVGVSWKDARAFCKWLTEHEQANEGLTGTQRYDLPSTEQWSQIAGTNRYPWGATFPPAQNQGNYAGREVRETDVARTDWPPQWAPAVLEQYQDPQSVGRSHVGSYEANVTAFADLGGNAAEWCSTPYDPSLNRLDQWTLKPSRLKQPNASGDLRVVRGASWADSHPDLLRTDAHWAEPASTRNDRIGFRVVLVEDFL